MIQAAFANPFKPGAGHYPPYLAGREAEQAEFLRLLDQETVLENLVLTGLRGVGKTVLTEKFKPQAQSTGWLWTGSDISESVSISEENLAVRIITDLALLTSRWSIETDSAQKPGFSSSTEKKLNYIDYGYLLDLYNNIPGLNTDKLKGVLEYVWNLLKDQNFKGMIFAYDEAQNLADNAGKDQYPLSVLLDTFQSLQRKGIPFMLALVGLPTLFPKLVEARTYAERMFRVITLDRLTKDESREAIIKPIEVAACPIHFDKGSVDLICDQSSGYPYFIQFICREVFDIWIAAPDNEPDSSVPISAITQKLDTNFFAGRWATTTDRQRDLLVCAATLENSSSEFSVQEIAETSQNILEKGFSPSHCNQVLSTLTREGLIYKNRYGKYSFSVPLFDEFINRQLIDYKR